ncbi:MAG TPA: UpxY family transcription antiterminator [candidate division WOR-3 bacterium]|uniref:UpxY family transcription antiterminator n=1 Tax=candidate division WOR-3 bacterium TaxID=2052148 RepID=A0A9C9EKK5_UNCW3|nr:UpxY family transcription antiterminator [candidate division WOR-3 bacterium]
MSWFAAYTRCNHERVVNKLLTDKGINTFLPTIIVPSRRKDRKILIKRPLFPNYLFVELDEVRDNWLKTFRTPGLVKICGNGRPMPVPDEEIESIRIFVNSDRNLYPLPYLQVGMRVRVISGPLAGAIGILIKENRKKRRLVVSVELMGQSVAATLFDDEVKPY